MARKATDALWLGSIVIGVAATAWFSLHMPSPAPAVSDSPSPAPAVSGSPHPVDGQRLSIRGVHVGMTGKDALEASNKPNRHTPLPTGTLPVAQRLTWMLPQIRLDASHHVASVSGQTLERDGVRVAEVGGSVSSIPEDLLKIRIPTDSGGEYDGFDGPVIVRFQVDRSQVVTSIFLGQRDPLPQ